MNDQQKKILILGGAVLVAYLVLRHRPASGAAGTQTGAPRMSAAEVADVQAKAKRLGF